MNRRKKLIEESGEKNMITGLSKEKRNTRSKISSEVLDVIAKELEGKRYGYVKVIVQDSYIFAIEENERIHLE